MPRAVRLLMPIVVAVVLGPLIAGLAVCVLLIAGNLFDPTGSLVDLFKAFVVYIIFAYISGGAIALLAGILVSLWMISRPPNLIVVVAAAAIAAVVYLGLGKLGLFSPMILTNERGFLMIIPLAMFAAAGCWLLTRRFALRHQAVDR